MNHHVVGTFTPTKFHPLFWVLLVLSCLQGYAEDTLRIERLKGQLSQELGENQTALLYQISSAYARNNMADSAMVYAAKCSRLAKEKKNIPFVVKSTILKGKCSAMVGFYKPALNDHFNVLSDFRITSDELKADLFLSIAQIYNESRQAQSGLPYALKAKATYLEIGNQQKLANCLNVIGYVFERQSEFQGQQQKDLYLDSALACYQQAFDLASKNHWLDLVASSSENLGSVYEDWGQLEKDSTKRSNLLNKARKYYRKAYEINKEIQNHFDMVRNLNDLGDTFQKLAEYDSALFYYEKNLALAREFNYNNRLMFALDDLSETYYAKGNYKKAYLVEDENENLVKEYYGQENLIALNRLKVLYETEKKDFELKKQSTNRTVLLLIIVLISVLLVFLFFVYRQSRKSRKLLATKNQELETLVATKNRFFSIIAHDLRSPFTSIMGLTSFATDKKNPLDFEELNIHMQLTHELSTRVFKLIENLLEWSRIQTGALQFIEKEIVIRDIIDNNLSLLKSRAAEKNISLESQVEPGVLILGDEHMIDAVVRNLLSNAIKFTPKGGSVQVKVEIEGGKVHLSVKDSGVGIKPETLKKLFLVSESFSTKGTLNETGSGLGLILVKEFVDLHKGSVRVESELNNGTTFHLTLPGKSV